MPERQTPVMRAPTTSERLRDTLRKLYEGASEQPLGQIADALGLSDLQGMADQESGDQPNTGLKLGMAGRKVPVPQVVAKMGGAGGRIKPSGQSGLDQALKVPRFRSEHGTFVKHEGEWWRLPKQPGDAPTMKLQRLEKLHEMEGEGMKPRVLEERTVNVDDFYKGVLEAKGTVEPGSAGPKRRGASSSRPQPTLRSAPVEPEPIRAYHGTPDRSVKVPDPNRGVEVSNSSWYSTSRDVADQYQYPREYGEIVDAPRGRVIEANIRPRNPMRVDFKGKPGEATRLSELTQDARAKGHDSLIVDNVDDSVDSSKLMGTSIAVFDKAIVEFLKKYGLAGAAIGSSLTPRRNKP